MSTPPALALENVHASFGAQDVLRNISLTVITGERLVICGPSGSGKSTMIRCINGLERARSGRVMIGGETLTHDAASLKRVRRDVGMVFQSFNLFPHLTVLQNCILAPMSVKGQKREDAVALAMECLARVKIPEQAKKYPSQLSGGQQQRAAIARVLCMRPRIMLFDEPTSALDPEMIKEVLDTIVELAGLGVTMLCVTHEMGFARQVADRVIFMDGGEIVESGPPDSLFSAPQTERLQRFLAQILRHS